MGKQRIQSQAGFTLIEVGVASLILVIGFIGMIRAMTFTSGLMDHARRQTVAAQILVHEIEQLRLRSWTEINALPAGPTVMEWSAIFTYQTGDLVSKDGAWYRSAAANAGNTPGSAPSFWIPYSGPVAGNGVSDGARYRVSRTATTLAPAAGSVREITFTVTWTVASGRTDDYGAPVVFTYTRVNTAYFGKNGLNLTYQRS